jgi:protein TonB
MNAVCSRPTGSHFELQQLEGSFAHADEGTTALSDRHRGTSFPRREWSEWHCGVVCSVALHIGVAALIVMALIFQSDRSPPTVVAFSASLVELPDYAERSSSPQAQGLVPHLSMAASNPMPQARPSAAPIKRVPPRSEPRAAVPELSLATKQNAPRTDLAKPVVPASGSPLLVGHYTAAEAVAESSTFSSAEQGSSSGGAASIEGAEAIGALRSSYAQVVAARLERAKRFPQRALQRGIQGEVVLRLKIASDGQPEISRIDDSSGYDILDGEVLRMVDRASPFPKPPPGLVAANRLEYIIPVSFRLRG